MLAPLAWCLTLSCLEKSAAWSCPICELAALAQRQARMSPINENFVMLVSFSPGLVWHRIA